MANQTSTTNKQQLAKPGKIGKLINHQTLEKW